MRSDAEIAESNATLDDAIADGPEAAIRWLRCAFHTHRDQLAHMRAKAAELRAELWRHAPRPLSVAHARMCKVCRVCEKPDAGPFTFQFGGEYAHTVCLKTKAEGGGS